MTIPVVRFVFGGQEAAAAGSGRPWTVVYDGQCKVCGRMVRLLDRWDVADEIEIIPFQNTTVLSRFPWIPAGSELFWRIVKLQHAMGSGLAWQMLTQMHARGIETNWPAIERYELTDGPKLHALMRVQPGRFGRNVDGVFTRGRAIAQRLGR